MRTKQIDFDFWLFIITLVLTLFGLVMLFSASFIYSLERFDNGYFLISKYFGRLLIGFFALYLFMKLRYQFLCKWAYGLLFISLLFLVFTLIPGFGVEVKGATRWLSVGLFSFQPAEIAKFALIFYFSVSMSKRLDKMNKFTVGILPHLIICSIFIILILRQPDFGTAFVIGSVMVLMLFLSGAKSAQLLAVGLLASPIVVYLVMSEAYRKKRILSFLNPWNDPRDTGYQIIQSFVAFFNGGFLGKGLGDGSQKLFFLPDPHTDFIFSVIGEELGFVGVCLTMLLFIAFIYRGFRIAIACKDHRGKLLAFGITALIGLQAIFNIGVCMSVFPTKGIPLPFISYGGTTIIVFLAMVGVLLNISISSRRGHET